MRVRSLVVGCVLAAACAAPDAEGGPSLADGPLYAVMYEVYDDVGSSSYLNLVSSLDIDAVDPADAIEFAGGRAFLQVHGGDLFVGEPTSPIVHRYAVADDGKLVEKGKISFANYGLESGTIDAWSLVFVSDEEAWLYDYREGTQIRWNPETMEILGAIEAPEAFHRDGWSLDGSPSVVRGNRLYRAIFWADYDTVTYSDDYLLAIYDTERGELIETRTETTCPAPGNLVHVDEADNIYFSSWIWPMAGVQLYDAPKGCVRRLPAGQDTFDPEWSLDYAEVSGGDEGAMFTYVGDGAGLVSIFDAASAEADEADPWAYAGSPVWSLWNVDVEAGTGTPVSGVPANSGAYTPVLFEDRTFVLVPTESWETELYELKDGVATPGLDIPGWSYAFVQVW